MMNCQEIAQLVSEMKDHPVTRRQRLSVWLHLTMCRMCATYRKQLDFISRLSRGMGDPVTTRGGDETLSPECKQRIRDALRKSRPR
jgi:hypothetical protein